jgi:GTPase SAR1 family protein
MTHQSLHNLPEKSFREIFNLFTQMIWFNYLQPKLSRAKKKNNPAINLESQKLHLQAHKLQGELSILKAELEALPFVCGKIYPRTQTDKKSGKTRNFHILRTHLNGKPQDKYIVQTKKKEADLSLAEAQQLIKNADKADSLKKEIKEREYQIAKLEGKLSIIEGCKIQLSEPMKKDINNLLIGRDKEFAQLQNNLLHNISTLLIGEPGVGKSYLLKNLIDSQTRSVLWIESLKAARSVLIESVIAKLHSDGNLEIRDENYSFSLSAEEVKSKCLKNKSIDQLAEIIQDSVIQHDYIAVINSMTGLTQANQTIIDKLLSAGVPIFACTNRIKPSIELESLYRRFTKLELEPLKNNHLKEIIQNKIANIKVDENHSQILTTKIMNASCGNVGIADKMIKDAQALSLGGNLTDNQIRSIQEPNLPRKYFDLTPIVFFAIAGFAVLRFIGIGTNDTLLYIIGGIAFILSMAFGRLMLKAWRG